MARIRTIKPEFFRHEALQDLEAANPGKNCMLVFAGLWTISDKNGVFEYRPRLMKLDILPFLDFDMQATLDALEGAGFVKSFESDGKLYGVVPSFGKHQRITGKEAEDGQRYPDPSQGKFRETSGKQQGNNGETPENQPVAQEREKEREKERYVHVSDKPKRPEQKILEEDAAPKPAAKKNGWAIWVDANREVGRPDPLPSGQMTKAAQRLQKLLNDDAVLLEVMVNFLCERGGFEERQGFQLTTLEKSIEKFRPENQDPNKPVWLNDGYGWMSMAERNQINADMDAEFAEQRRRDALEEASEGK